MLRVPGIHEGIGVTELPRKAIQRVRSPKRQHESNDLPITL
jgi:hypothetical protein